ncbi:hypothetical protein [Pseudomonas sp. FME51]|uniref:hypothetical protein n=1 Tax=Pseudomonas sp. FME51 TaxID=2742609 RepID=UPI001869044D|nr:hypothetical protein [Pseudomonas sp. FME51]
MAKILFCILGGLVGREYRADERRASVTQSLAYQAETGMLSEGDLCLKCFHASTLDISRLMRNMSYGKAIYVRKVGADWCFIAK